MPDPYKGAWDRLTASVNEATVAVRAAGEREALADLRRLGRLAEAPPELHAVLDIALRPLDGIKAAPPDPVLQANADLLGDLELARLRIAEFERQEQDRQVAEIHRRQRPPQRARPRRADDRAFSLVAGGEWTTRRGLIVRTDGVIVADIGDGCMAVIEPGRRPRVIRATNCPGSP